MEATNAQLLERKGELAAIASALDAAAAGEGGLLLIEGEAGAGKTALLDAAGRLGAAREMLVLSARGGEYERDFPYGVIRQLFEREVANGAGGVPALAGSAALAAPVFEPDAASLAGGDPFAVAHGLYWLAADLAASRPLLLLVDDAQWGDRASLRALAYLARRLDGLPVALVLTVRVGDPGEPADLLDELRRQPRAELVEPPPLSAGAVTALVATEVGGEPSGDFAARCFEASAGNPFLLTQLLRTLDSEDGASAPDAERITELAAAGAAGSLLSRLARLGEHATAVARAIAVLEPNAEARLVAALAELPSEEIAAVSARMIGARLLADSRPLSFVHPLVRAAVLGEVSGPLRAAAHRRAARLLDEDGAAVDAVAAHLLLAEPDGDEWAVGELRAAARAALGRGAPDAAIRYLRRALREPPAPDDRLAIGRELGTALLAADDAEGIEVLLAVRSEVEDPLERAEIVAELALSLTIRGRADEAMALLEESLAKIPDPQGTFAMVLRGYLLAQAFWGAERRPEEILLRPEDELDACTLEGRMCLHILAILGALGLLPLDRAQELAERTIADRATIEADSLAGWPPQGSLTALVLNDRRDLTAGLFEVILEATQRRGAMPGIAGAHGNKAYCHYLDGELREAQADAEIAVQIVAERGLPVPIFAWSGALLRCLTARGEHEAAAALLAEPWIGEVVPGFPGALFLCARGELLLAGGRAAEARDDFLAAARRVDWLPLANPEVLGWRPGLAACEASLGNDEEARRLAAEAVERAGEGGGARGIGVTQRVLGEVTGGAEGIELLRRASTALAGTNARLQYARALVSFGAALRRANRRRDAREPLREGLDLAHRCGAAPLEELARTELAATGARPRRAVLSGVESLTPSELRVARMAAEGMTNREIAQALTVTAKTVETHLRHVYQKLDVSRRGELAPLVREVDVV